MITTGPRFGVRAATKKKEHPVQRQGFEPLLKREIDKRIEHVMAEVATAVVEQRAGKATAEARRLAPRWITPRVLVERMKRFISYN